MTTPSPDDAQKSAARPWVLGVLCAWGAAMLSYLALAAYLLMPGRGLEMRVVVPWLLITAFIVRITEGLCMRRLTQLAGEGVAASWGDGRVSLGIQLALIVLLVFLLGP